MYGIRLRNFALRGQALGLGFLCLSALIGRSALGDSLQKGNTFQFGECSARFANGQLELRNAHVRRVWRLSRGQLYATSLYDLDRHVEWIGLPASEGAPVLLVQREDASPIVRGGSGVFGPTEDPSLRLEVEEANGLDVVDYEFQIFPGASGIRMWMVRRARPATASSGAHLASQSVAAGEALEHLWITKPHIRLTQAVLRDRTDDRNELVFENEWLLHPNEAAVKLQGNIFSIEDVVTGDGLIFLKEAPQPEMRPVKTEFDAKFSGTTMAVPVRRTSTNAPHFEVDLYGDPTGENGTGHPCTLMTYHGGRLGRIAALHQFQRQIRPYIAGRDGQLVSNTWGDRSLGDKLNDDFVRREIDGGRRLGIDIMQIDDGWETGNTMNLSKGGGVWNGFWEATPHFWEPDSKRFPGGLLPLSEYAHANGMKLGLWYGPDSYNDFGSWRRDADRILSLHRESQVDAFKFDSVKIHSRSGEQNYQSLLTRILNGSKGKILLDLDVTAETRQGYFGDIAAGPLFVENRYTDTHRYWPHQTLRNLWKLSQYIDPLRLRMEFLNPERNQTLYVDDPLAPAQYRPDCLFAMTMFGSPLAWFETTGVSPEYIREVAPLVAEWKRQRDTIYQGTMLPIGEPPDGVAWTGFASVDATGRGGYLLLFRELNPKARWTAPTGIFGPGNFSVTPLGGTGTVTQTGDGFAVEIPQPLGFVWVKLQSRSTPPE